MLRNPKTWKTRFLREVGYISKTVKSIFMILWDKTPLTNTYRRGKKFPQKLASYLDTSASLHLAVSDSHRTFILFILYFIIALWHISMSLILVDFLWVSFFVDHLCVSNFVNLNLFLLIFVELFVSLIFVKYFCVELL